MSEPAKPGDVVQLDPSRGDWAAGLLFVVEEVRPWGLVGFVPCGCRGETSVLPLRISHGGYARVGALTWPLKWGPTQ